MAYEIAAAGERLLSERSYSTQVAEDWIADVDGLRGEVGFIQGALQQSARGQNDFACASRGRES
jgi:hypothetical protein